MRIPRISSILLIICQILFAQIHVQLDNDNHFKFDSVKEIPVILDSILSTDKDLSTVYFLNDYYFDNSYHFNYNTTTTHLLIDTVITISDHLRSFVNDRLFVRLLNTKPPNETEKLYYKTISTSPFLNNNATLHYFQYDQSKVGAFVNYEPVFYSSINGMVGAERIENKSWSLSGQLDMHVENLWKTAGTIDIKWRRLNKETQLINFRLDEPYLYVLPFGAGFSFGQEFRNGNYISTNLEYSLIQTQSGFGMWSVGYRSNSIRSTSKGDSLGISDQLSHWIVLSSNNGKRINRFLYDEGLYWDITTRLGVADQSTEKLSLGELSIHMGRYFPLNSLLTLHSSIYGQGIISEDSNIHNALQIRYGGVKTLRGYNEDIFSSNSVCIPTMEGLFTVNNNIQLNVFIEGAIQKSYSPLPFGYGIGFKQIMQQSFISIQYGLNRDCKLPEGKVHLSIESRL